MQNTQPSLFARDHTFFGVCEGLGEDFGFDPLYLRLALPVPLFFFPAATLGAYLAAGVLILLTRLLFPNPRSAIPAEAEAGPASEPPPPQPAATSAPSEKEGILVDLAA